MPEFFRQMPPLPEQDPDFKGRRQETQLSRMAERMKSEDLQQTLYVSNQREVRATNQTSYIKQISEPGGLQTCYPTSLLNAWMHHGLLSLEQAREIQEKFRSDLNHLFYKRGDINSVVFSGNPYNFSQYVTERVGRSTELLNIGVGELDEQSIAKIILQELNKDNVLVAGSPNHAVLVNGYEKNGTVLVTRDPLTPDSLSLSVLTVLARDLKKRGNSWITIVPKPSLQEQTEMFEPAFKPTNRAEQEVFRPMPLQKLFKAVSTAKKESAFKPANRVGAKMDQKEVFRPTHTQKEFTPKKKSLESNGERKMFKPVNPVFKPKKSK